MDIITPKLQKQLEVLAVELLIKEHGEAYSSYKWSDLNKEEQQIWLKQATELISKQVMRFTL